MAMEDIGQSSHDNGAEAKSESSISNVEIKIKMLDSSTHSIRVNKDVTIPALKEQLESLVGVPASQQRLIFRGKVLKDDHLLSSYHVEDGDSLHLVTRQNVEPSAVNNEGLTSSQESQDGTSTPSHPRQAQVTHSVVLGTINITNAGEGGMPDLNRIVSAVLNSVGSGNASFEGASNVGVNMGVLPPNIQSTIANGSIRTGVNTVGQSPQTTSNVPTQVPMQVVPDAMETLSSYLNRVRENFISNGFATGGASHAAPELGTSQSSVTSDASNVGQNLPSAATPATPWRSLTPAALGNIIHNVQEVLTNQAGASFSRLAGQLENESTVTDGVARSQLQTSAVWTGNMMQQLGALLMELGRTTLTMRMGQSPAEAVVNCGPAVFISANGPNPIMVQPLPFQTGFPLGDFRVQPPQAMTRMARPPVAGVGPRGVNIQINARDLGSALASGALPPNMQLSPQILASLASGTSPSHSEPAQTVQSESGGQSPPVPENASGTSMQVLPGVVQGAIMIIQENGGSRVVPVMPRATTTSNISVPPASSENGPSNSGFIPINARFQQQMDLLAAQMRPVQPGTFQNQTINSMSTQGPLPIPIGVQQQSATITESARPPVGITITVPLHITPVMPDAQPQPSQPQQSFSHTPGVESSNQSAETVVTHIEGEGVISSQTEIIERSEPEATQKQESLDTSTSNAGESYGSAEPAVNFEKFPHEESEPVTDGLQNLVREQSKTSFEESGNNKEQKSGRIDVAPAGLGLGSLPPLPSKPCRRSKAKHQELPVGEDSKGLSFQRVKGNARSEEPFQSESSSKDVLQGSMLQRGANRDGEQSSSPSNTLSNVMGQLMRSPIMGTFVNQVAQRMGEVQSSPTGLGNPQTEDSFDSLDIAGMLQQALPLVSQLFGRSPPGSLDQTPSSEFGLIEQNHSQDPQNGDSSAQTEGSSQVELEETAEKVRNGEGPDSIFRSVAENAAMCTLGQSSRDEIHDLAKALSQTTGLTDAYLSLLCHDLASRLTSEVQETEVSQLQNLQVDQSRTYKQMDEESESS